MKEWKKKERELLGFYKYRYNFIVKSSLVLYIEVEVFFCGFLFEFGKRFFKLRVD